MGVSGPLAIEWLASGAFVLFLGGLIKFAGWTWLLAGYSESTSSVSDDVIQDIAGNTILRIGVAVLVVGALVTVSDPPPYLTVVVGAIILVDVTRLLYRLNTTSTSRTD